jgi:hypothetical protein
MWQRFRIRISPQFEEFLGSIRFCDGNYSHQEGAIFMGNLRGEPAAVYERLSGSLQERVSDRYRLFLVENLDGKPVVIVLPSRNDPQTATLAQKILAAVLLVATIATSLKLEGYCKALMSRPIGKILGSLTHCCWHLSSFGSPRN